VINTGVGELVMDVDEACRVRMLMDDVNVQGRKERIDELQTKSASSSEMCLMIPLTFYRLINN
jgi:hypothetical protein